MRIQFSLANFIVVLCCVLSVAGCGSQFKGGAPVSGVVTLDGEKLSTGSVTFIGSDGAAGAVGFIANGFYELSQSANVTGIEPGSYQVVVHSWKEEPGQMKADGNFSAGIALIPKKYMAAKTSGLTAEVPAKGAKLDFALTSK